LPRFYYGVNINMDTPSLTVADLASLKSLLSAAYARGAFRVEEASAVGTIYDRLSVFLDAQKSAEPQSPPQGETNA